MPFAGLLSVAPKPAEKSAFAVVIVIVIVAIVVGRAYVERSQRLRQ
jgi:hypothetical protein